MKKFTVTHKNVTYEVAVEETEKPDQLRVTIEGEEHLVEVVAKEPAIGTAPTVRPNLRPRAEVSMGLPGEVVSPLPGSILKVLVKEGDPVKPDTIVCVLEAMKMETQVLADQAGTLAEVLVNPGDKVDGGQLLVRVDPD